jgi:hypothetical protein
MIEVIKRAVENRGITRICHFTPSRNLSHILTGTMGILATKHLQDGERNIFTPTDLKRLDGHIGYICCSIEYPNPWYFDKARSQDTLFKDWVVLFINPQYLWTPGTLFCPRNAASDYGSAVAEGEQAFMSMFDRSVSGAGGMTFSRHPQHLTSCPTDNQAEVLVPDLIGISDITGIAISTEEQAKNEAARLEILGISEDQYRFIIAPDLFDKRKLSKLIRSGQRPNEIPWNPREEI